MQFEKWFQIDLDRPRAHPVDLGFPVFSGDNDSVRVGVEVMRNGVAQNISGTVSGHIILPSGATVPTTSINADSDGNRAWIDLPESAFALQGRIQLAIRVTDGTTKTVLLSASATVRLTETTTAYDPSHEVPTSSEMIDAYEDCLDAISENTHPVSYDPENPQTLTAAEKAQARQNIGAESETRANALRGFLNYGYGTPATDQVGSAYYTRSGVMLTITGSNGNSTVPIRIRLNGAMSVGSTGTVPAAWDDALALVTGHTYRWKVRQVSGTGSKPVLARVFAGRSYTLVDGAVTDDRDYESVCVFTYADTPVNLCMAYARSGGATFTDCVVECVLTEVYSEQELPSAPTGNGTYVLKCTVANGVPTFSWVSDGGASLLSAPPTLTGGESD